MFISGWLYATKKIDKPLSFLKRTLTKLLAEYYMFILLIIPVYFCFASEEISIVQMFKLFFLRPRVYGLNHLWFMIYIVICYLLLPEIYKLADKFCDSISKEIVMLLVWCLFFCGIEILMGLESAWINCFLIGYFMNRLVRLYNVKQLYLLICISPLMVLTNIYRISVNTQSGLLKNESVIAYSKVFFAVFIFLVLYMISERMFIGRFVRILKWTDRYSYDVYLVHHIFIIGPFSVFGTIKNTFIALVFVLCAVYICAIGLNHITNMIKQFIKKQAMGDLAV